MPKREMTQAEAEEFIFGKPEMKPGYLYKNSRIKEFQMDDTTKNGYIKGYFATFHHDVSDSYGDVIRKGAFLETIAERKLSGTPFPMCYNHDFNQVIGRVVDIGEDDMGAYFTGEFYPSERAQEIRNICKTRALNKFSFAYDTLDSGKIRLANGEMANELRKLKLYEVSIVLVPANPRAVMTEIKSGKKRTRAKTIHEELKLHARLGQLEREERRAEFEKDYIRAGKIRHEINDLIEG